MDGHLIHQSGASLAENAFRPGSLFSITSGLRVSVAPELQQFTCGRRGKKPAEFRYCFSTIVGIQAPQYERTYTSINTNGANVHDRHIECSLRICAPAMNAFASASLIADLEAAVRDGSPERRARILRDITGLFLADSDRLDERRIDIFDDVLVRLAERGEARTLAELSAALADLVAAPQQTLRRLAGHESAAVAGPVLRKSPALSDADLISIAGSRGQQHLLAISGRQALSEALTDVLVKYAGRDALRTLAKNTGARFSNAGCAALLRAAERDDTLAESLGSRPDLPPAALQQLLSTATETVRTRLRKAPSVPLREKIEAALTNGAINPGKKASCSPAEAYAAIVTLNRTGKLNDSTVNRFAIRREYPNLIAALALLSGAEIEIIAPLLDESDCTGLVIACRAAGLNWQTTLAIINNRQIPPLSKQQLEQASEFFDTLFVSSAQYTIRFEPHAARLASIDNKLAPAELG